MKYLRPALYWPTRTVLAGIALLLARVEVIGREKVPRRGALILTSNHLNNADPPMLTIVSPRRLVFMAKHEALRWPIVGLFIRLAGAFPVRRFEADIGALRQASCVLHEGEVLAMFPEGTRSKKGKLGSAHPGTALVALRTGAPILPIGISGTETIGFPRVLFNALRLRRAQVRVVIGDPFFLPPVSRITAEEVSRCTDVIMSRIASLLPPSYRGRYGEGDGDGDSAAGEPVAREGAR
jgi:1-acyl-sn-glycerol-3-phosphate acyltransferase